MQWREILLHEEVGIKREACASKNVIENIEDSVVHHPSNPVVSLKTRVSPKDILSNYKFVAHDSCQDEVTKKAINRLKKKKDKYPFMSQLHWQTDCESNLKFHGSWNQRLPPEKERGIDSLLNIYTKLCLLYTSWRYTCFALSFLFFSFVSTQTTPECSFSRSWMTREDTKHAPVVSWRLFRSWMITASMVSSTLELHT